MFLCFFVVCVEAKHNITVHNSEEQVKKEKSGVFHHTDKSAIHYSWEQTERTDGNIKRDGKRTGELIIHINKKKKKKK